MSLSGAAALAVFCALIGVSLKSRSAELTLLLSIAAGAAIFAGAVSKAQEVFSALERILPMSELPVGPEILLRSLAVCFLGEFAADTCREAGAPALAGNVELIAKLSLLLIALPLLIRLCEWIFGVME